MGNILIIDDEEAIRTVLRDILTDEGFSVFTAGDGPTALTLLKQEPIDVVFLDVQMPLMGGIEVLQQLHSHYPLIQVVVMSGHANIDIAVRAIKIGAFDFIEKPIDLNRVLTTTQNALKVANLTQENLKLKKNYQERPFIGHSPTIELIKQQVKQMAQSRASCLITGENGSGKELIAQMIHSYSNRSNYNFVAINCAAIPDTLIESEFFGHEKGSFTGAIDQKMGKLEQAHKGTLFLDEVGDLSLPAQAKLLRALQEQTFTRVGGTKNLKVDVRLIVATNKNLTEAIKQGTFREDLLFRFNVLPITLPSLRERKEDISDLINFFIAENGQKKTFSPEALTYLENWAWPGNVRQLKNFCERLLILSPMQEFSREEVEKYLHFENTRSAVASHQSPLTLYKGMKLTQARDLFEKQLIEETLKGCGNISGAAEILGMFPSNLHAKIKKLGVKPP